MAARQAQAAWLDSAMHPTTTEMRIARTRVERLAHRNKELNDRIEHQTRRIVELDRANERLRRANYAGLDPEIDAGTIGKHDGNRR